MPVSFAALTARDRDWSLDDLVAEANRMLPEVVPGDAAGRAKLDVNARLIRHYATEGVLPKPLKEGVEARYDSDHLVRVLALRRLLAEGYPSAVAGRFLQRHDRERLARFLLGELHLDLDLAPGGPPAVERAPRLSGDARARLAAMRARAGLPPLPADEGLARDEGGDRDHATGRLFVAPLAAPSPDEAEPSAAAAAPAADVAPETGAPEGGAPEGGVAWTRFPLVPGLELHVRADFVDPATPAAWSALRNTLLARLEEIALERAARR